MRYGLLPCALLLCALAPATARAAGLPLLTVHRTVDTADCPDATALAASVAEQMKRPALQPADTLPGPDRGLDVQIYKSEAGYTAIIQAGGKTRQISDKGSKCGGLAAALAVSIAVMLDSEPLPVEPAPPPPPHPTPAPAETFPPDEQANPSVVAQITQPGDPTEFHRFRVAVSAAPLISIGLLRPVVGGFTGEAELAMGRFSVGLGMFVLPGQTYTYGPGQVTVDLISSLARGCANFAGDGDLLRLAFCLEAFGGAMHGGGEGYSVNRTTTQGWAAAGTSVLFRQRIWGRISWGIRAEMMIPLLRNVFLVDNIGTAFTAGSLGGAFDAELRVSIW